MTAPNNKTTNILFTLRKKYTYLKLHCGNSRQRILFARIEYCSPASHAHEQSFVVLDKKTVTFIFSHERITLCFKDYRKPYRAKKLQHCLE